MIGSIANVASAGSAMLEQDSQALAPNDREPGSNANPDGSWLNQARSTAQDWRPGQYVSEAADHFQSDEAGDDSFPAGSKDGTNPDASPPGSEPDVTGDGAAFESATNGRRNQAQERAESRRAPSGWSDQFIDFLGEPGVQVALVAAGLALATPAAPAAAASGMGLFYRASALLSGLFSRFRKNDLLAHEVRTKLFAAIEGHPGVTFTELKQRFGLSTGVLYHHLRLLEKHELIRTRRLGARRIYHRAGLRLADEAPPLSKAQRRLLETLREHRTLDRKSLAERLGQTPPAVSYHAKALSSRGLITTWYDPDGQLILSLVPSPPETKPLTLLPEPLPA